jgi:hypothetical protein
MYNSAAVQGFKARTNSGEQKCRFRLLAAWHVFDVSVFLTGLKGSMWGISRYGELVIVCLQGN